MNSQFRHESVPPLEMYALAHCGVVVRGGMEARVGHSTSEALFNHVYFTYAFQALGKYLLEGVFAAKRFLQESGRGEIEEI